MNKILSLYGKTVSLIVIVFVVSFSVLALAFLSLTAMEERDRVRDLEHSILLANSQVRDFIITRDPTYAKETEFILGRASSRVAEGVRADNFQQLQNEVLLYLHVIGNLIDVYQERGFSGDDGLEGRIRRRLRDGPIKLDRVLGGILRIDYAAS